MSSPSLVNRRRRRTALALVAATLGALLLVAWPALTGADGAGDARLRRILVDPELDGGAAAALNPADLSLLLTALASPSELAFELSADEVAAARALLVAQPVHRLLAHLDAWIVDPSEPARVARALDLMGEVADARDLDLLTRVFARARGTNPRMAEDAFVSALARLIERDPATLAQLPSLARRLEPLEAELIVRAVVAGGDPRGLDLFADWLGRDEELDVELLRRIATLARATHAAADRGVAEAVRPYLGHESVTTVQRAILALGGLADDDSVADLIDQLESPSRGVVAQAARALEAITGVRLGTDAAGWRAWLDTESSWFEEEARASFAALASSREAEVLTALRTLSRRAWPRRAIAEEMLFLLDDRAASVRLATCSALGRVSSRVATADLARVVVDDEEAVALAALAALHAITGSDEPLDSELWRTLARD